MFWEIISPEIVSYISERLSLDGESNREGPQGPAVQVTEEEVRSVVRMIVFAISEGPGVATSFTEYLQLHEGRPGLGEHPIRAERWKRLAGMFKGINSVQLSEFFTASFVRFWNVRGALWIAFDESIVPYTGSIPFSVHIERKPNPDGALVYVACGITTAGGLPVPLILIPNFSVDCTGHGLSPPLTLELACNWITRLQQDGNLPAPVCVIADAAFGSVETMQRHLPGIRFIMSSRATDHKQVIGERLGPRECRTVCRGDVIQTVYKDVALVFNITTFFQVSEAVDFVSPLEPVLKPETITILRQLEDSEARTLIQMCGLPSSGPKEALLRRLARADYQPTHKKTRLASTTSSVANVESGSHDEEQQRDTASIQKRTLELQAMTKPELVRHLKTNLGAKASGNKDDLIRRILEHEGDDIRAVSGRFEAFLANKLSGRPPQVDLYKRTFNFVDRLDVLLSYVPFPWVLKHFDLVFVVWLIRVGIVATYSACSDYCWHSPDSETENNPNKNNIVSFSRQLARAMYEEEK